MQREKNKSNKETEKNEKIEYTVLQMKWGIVNVDGEATFEIFALMHHALFEIFYAI